MLVRQLNGCAMVSGESVEAAYVAQADPVPAAEQRGVVQLPVVRLIRTSEPCTDALTCHHLRIPHA